MTLMSLRVCILKLKPIVVPISTCRIMLTCSDPMALFHMFFTIALPVIMLPILKPFHKNLTYGYLSAATKLGALSA